MGFQRNMSGSVALWTGAPDCDAAQTFLRNWLREHTGNFPSAWVRGDTRLQGNLGETIAFCVGTFSDYNGLQCYSANAFSPFSGISRSEIDLLWVGFGNTPSEDYIVHQEVKTTYGSDLAYASSLLDDYEKAFGSNPRTTLNTHLQAIKARLKYQHQRPDLAMRITALQATSTQTADRVLVVPTLVHDLSSQDPAIKMAGISAVLSGNGWRRVSPWAIGLSQLESRLGRITQDLA